MTEAENFQYLAGYLEALILAIGIADGENNVKELLREELQAKQAELFKFLASAGLAVGGPLLP